MNFIKVNGQESTIQLFAISTCVWCRRTKALLSELGLGYEYVNVDELDEVDMDAAQELVTRFNPDCSFPTIIVGGKHCIIGFDEDEIRALQP